MLPSALSNYDFRVEKPPRTMDVHVRRINGQATDVDVHRTELQKKTPAANLITAGALAQRGLSNRLQLNVEVGPSLTRRVRVGRSGSSLACASG